MSIETGKLYLAKAHSSQYIGHELAVELNGAVNITLYGTNKDVADITSISDLVQMSDPLSQPFYYLTKPLPKYILFVGTADTINVIGYDLTYSKDIADVGSAVPIYKNVIGFDRNQDVYKYNRENPEWNHYTSIEHIIDDINATLDQHYSPEIQMQAYRNLALQLTGNSSGSGVTFTIWATLNPDAVVPSDGDAAPSADWVDISTLILGAATITLNGGASDLFFIDTEIMPDRFIIRYDCDNATNSTDIFIRKY